MDLACTSLLGKINLTVAAYLQDCRIPDNKKKVPVRIRAYLQPFLLSLSASQSAYHDHGKISLYIRKKELQIRSIKIAEIRERIGHADKNGPKFCSPLDKCLDMEVCLIRSDRSG